LFELCEKPDSSDAFQWFPIDSVPTVATCGKFSEFFYMMTILIGAMKALPQRAKVHRVADGFAASLKDRQFVSI